MLQNDSKQDRYCRFTYTPKTGEQEREWLHYADGTFEPVRRNGQLSRKWNDRRTDFQWRAVRKPADWRPWDEGAPLSWNHTLGEENKPDNWGNECAGTGELLFRPAGHLVHGGAWKIKQRHSQDRYQQRLHDSTRPNTLGWSCRSGCGPSTPVHWNNGCWPNHGGWSIWNNEGC